MSCTACDRAMGSGLTFSPSRRGPMWLCDQCREDWEQYLRDNGGEGSGDESNGEESATFTEPDPEPEPDHEEEPEHEPEGESKRRRT